MLNFLCIYKLKTCLEMWNPIKHQNQNIDKLFPTFLEFMFLDKNCVAEDSLVHTWAWEFALDKSLEFVTGDKLYKSH